MSSLDKLKKTSHRVRMMVFAILTTVFVIALYGYITEGVWWVTLGDGQFKQLWETFPEARYGLAMILSPTVLTIMAGIYWLQRLLLELNRGLFFSRKCMQCLKWLAWLSLFSVLHNMFWPLLASSLIGIEDAIELNIRPLSLLAILCLPVLVHLLSAARELDQENKEII
jgi:H+/Cl- antiporter ClcA